MNKINNELLNIMLEDMQKQDKLYKPTSFWAQSSKIIIDEVNKKGVENFRALETTRGFFVPTYSYPSYLENKKRYEKVEKELDLLVEDKKMNVKLQRLLAGQLQAFSDYRTLVASNIDKAPYTDKVSESKVGNPIEQYTFDDRNFSRSFLNYLLGLNFMKKHIDSSSIKNVMEIGGGFGTLGEILLKDERNECFYINADIPPVSYFSAHYLKGVFGKENIADYGDLKDENILDIDSLKTKYKALNICSWQVPKLKGKIDLFVNFISFQEMEPEVVNNYCKYIRELKPKYILLRNIQEGKKQKDENTIYGVETPILGDDYDTFLPEYKLVASDCDIFGFKTEDNFNSQLRLYIRK